MARFRAGFFPPSLVGKKTVRSRGVGRKMQTEAPRKSHRSLVVSPPSGASFGGGDFFCEGG